MDSQGAESVEWFAVVRVKLDPGCPDAMSTALLALGLESGLVTYQWCPELTQVIIASADEQSARNLGGRIAAVAKACGSLEVRAAVTSDRAKLFQGVGGQGV